MGAIKGHLNELGISIDQFPISAKKIAELISLVDENKVSNSVANQKIYPLLLENPEKSALGIAQENNWIQESDSNALGEFILAALVKFPDKVEAYKNGKKGLLGLFMGEVMKMSQGKADPKLTSQMLKKELEG